MSWPTAPVPNSYFHAEQGTEAVRVRSSTNTGCSSRPGIRHRSYYCPRSMWFIRGYEQCLPSRQVRHCRIAEGFWDADRQDRFVLRDCGDSGDPCISCFICRTCLIWIRCPFDAILVEAIDFWLVFERICLGQASSRRGEAYKSDKGFYVAP